MQRNKQLKLGKFVNTHGIKGEIRLLSDFYHEEELQPGKEIVIKDKTFTIKSTRPHKSFLLLALEGITNINDIEYLKGNDVYGDKISEDTSIPEFIDYEVILNDEVVGKVIDYFQQGSIWSLIVELNDGKQTNIPFVEEEFIKEIKENKIYLLDKGLI